MFRICIAFGVYAVWTVQTQSAGLSLNSVLRIPPTLGNGTYLNSVSFTMSTTYTRTLKGSSNVYSPSHIGLLSNISNNSISFHFHKIIKGFLLQCLCLLLALQLFFVVVRTSLNPGTTYLLLLISGYELKTPIIVHTMIEPLTVVLLSSGAQ